MKDYEYKIMTTDNRGNVRVANRLDEILPLGSIDTSILSDQVGGSSMHRRIFGGQYYDKYIKYKHKYLRAKQLRK